MRAMAVEVCAVEAGDAGRFLAAMLERVQAERDDRRGGVGAPDAEHAAFLAQLVVVEGMGGEHRRARGLWRVVARAYRQGAVRVCRPPIPAQGLLTQPRLDVNVKRKVTRRPCPQTALHSDYRQPRAGPHLHDHPAVRRVRGHRPGAALLRGRGADRAAAQGPVAGLFAGATAPGSPGSCAARGSASASPRSAR